MIYVQLIICNLIVLKKLKFCLVCYPHYLLPISVPFLTMAVRSMAVRSVFVPLRVGAVTLSVRSFLLRFGKGPRQSTIVAEESVGEIQMSTYVYFGFPAGISAVWETAVSSMEPVYILGCSYYNREGVLRDTQPCITGKALMGESAKDACVREASEESGLQPKTTAKLRCVVTEREGKCTYSTFMISAADCEPYKDRSSSGIGSTGHVKDDPNNRVQLFIYGTLADFAVLDSVRQRAPSKDGRTIKGLALINLGDLIRHC